VREEEGRSFERQSHGGEQAHLSTPLTVESISG
jgi:hypothetical protein